MTMIFEQIPFVEIVQNILIGNYELTMVFAGKYL